MKKILKIELGFLLLMGTAFAYGGFVPSEYVNKANDILKRDSSGVITSTNSTDTLGSSSSRWAKIWADDIDTTIATVGGVASGAITIDVDDTAALLVRKDGDVGDIFTVDTVNSHVKTTGKVIYTPSSDTSITAAVGITMTNSIQRIVGSGGAVDITADPQILAGEDGQIVIIQGTNDTNTVKIDDGTGVALCNGTSMTLGRNDNIQLMYDSGETEWLEFGGRCDLN